MTNEVISPLRRRMIEDMAIRKLSPEATLSAALYLSPGRRQLRPASENLHSCGLRCPIGFRQSAPTTLTLEHGATPQGASARAHPKQQLGMSPR
jgi:hypothetical protein